MALVRDSRTTRTSITCACRRRCCRGCRSPSGCALRWRSSDWSWPRGAGATPGRCICSRPSPSAPLVAVLRARAIPCRPCRRVASVRGLDPRRHRPVAARRSLPEGPRHRRGRAVRIDVDRPSARDRSGPDTNGRLDPAVVGQSTRAGSTARWTRRTRRAPRPPTWSSSTTNRPTSRSWPPAIRSSPRSWPTCTASARRSCAVRPAALAEAQLQRARRLLSLRGSPRVRSTIRPRPGSGLRSDAVGVRSSVGHRRSSCRHRRGHPSKSLRTSRS